MPNYIKGRGALSNREGRFEKTIRIEIDPAERPPASADTDYYESAARTVLTKNQSPDIPYPQTINPYMGCEHGCIYCYARATHSYLGLSPGLDFEKKIFIKKNLATQLKKELAAKNYRPEIIGLGVSTDLYQPIEKKTEITRKILKVLVETNHPVSIITKSTLIERDIDLLKQLAEKNLLKTSISVTTLNDDLNRRLEPRAASGGRRLKIIKNLAAAGIPVTVLVAPIIPALTDNELETIIAASAAAGARYAGYTMLRLPHEVADLFGEWLAQHYPFKKEKVLGQIREMHAGQVDNGEFFTRHTGVGPAADLIRQRFQLAVKRNQLLTTGKIHLTKKLFISPNKQLKLF